MRLRCTHSPSAGSFMHECFNCRAARKSTEKKITRARDAQLELIERRARIKLLGLQIRETEGRLAK